MSYADQSCENTDTFQLSSSVLPGLFICTLCLVLGEADKNSLNLDEADQTICSIILI